MLPILKSLADITKFMEGETYVLSSSIWISLARIEKTLASNPADSPKVAVFRRAMRADHMNNRITLESALTNKVLVLMHLLDHR